MRADFLQPGEEPLLVLPRDARSALDSWLGLLLFVVVVGGSAILLGRTVLPAFAPFAPAVLAVAAAFALVAGIGVLVRVRTTRNVVTADRVYHAHGKLRFYLSQTTYDRVTDLHVHQSLFGRWFGFGTVTVQTAGLGVSLVGVADPLAVKDRIEHAREAMVRRLIGDRAPAPRARVASEGSAAASAGGQPSRSGAPFDATSPSAGGRPAAVRWSGGPTPASVVAAYVPGALFLAFFLMASGTLAVVARAPWAAALPAGLVVLGVLVAVNATMQYRRTRYEIHAWGVAVSSGWLSRRRAEARFEKVTDVTVTQPILGRVFGYGTLQVNTAGGNDAPIQFQGVRRPDEVKSLVDLARADRGR